MRRTAYSGGPAKNPVFNNGVLTDSSSFSFFGSGLDLFLLNFILLISINIFMLTNNSRPHRCLTR